MSFLFWLCLLELNHRLMSVHPPLADFNLGRSRSAAGGRCSEADDRMTHERTRLRPQAAAVRDDLSFRMVVGCSIEQLNTYFHKSVSFRWFKSNKESQKESRSKDLLFFLPFSPCRPCPTDLCLYIRLWRTLIWEEAEALPVADNKNTLIIDIFYIFVVNYKLRNISTRGL